MIAGLFGGSGFVESCREVLIHSSVDFNLQIPANAATFMVLLALAWISLTLGRARPGPGD